MKTKKNSLYIIFTVAIIAFVAIISLLFLHMQRPIVESVKFENGINDVQRGVSVKIAPRGGSEGSWIKKIGSTRIKEKFLGAIYDINVQSIGVGTVNDWSLRIDFEKFAYLNKAWCGKVEIHQVEENLTQTLDLRNNPEEEVILNCVKEGTETFIALNPGDYIIYYPDEIAGEVPLDEGQKTVFGLIVYSRGVGGYKFNNCEINYTIISDYKNMPAFYIIIVLAGMFLLVLAYFVIIFIQQKHTQVLYEHEKLVAQETMSTFVGFVDAKDPYTAGHSERVAKYTRLIAYKLGYEGDEATQAYYCGLLHDAGKISVSEAVLNKKGALNDEEFSQIKQHTVKGYEMLKSLKTVPMASTAARSHHERYDGNGYPDRIAGEEIPEIARIISVADAFDAMNSNRVYRSALQMDAIIEQLETNRGKQFDPHITDIFLELIKSGEILD